MKTIKNLAFPVVLGLLLLAAPVPPSPAIAQSSTPTCSPANQSARVNDFVTFSASGGNGIYYWAGSNAAPVIGTGSTFGTRFLAPGTQIVVVSSNGRDAQCSVQVSGGAVLGVSDVTTGPEDIALWALAIGLIGAIAAYAGIFRSKSVRQR
jgi:hypothetical protein